MPNMPGGETTALEFSRQVRSERLVSAGRVVLLAVSLTADVLERGDTPGQGLAPALIVIACGLAYSLAAAALAWRADAPTLRAAVWLHAVDILLFSAVIATHGSSSPFYLYFLFLLLAAAIRWDRRGVAWTGMAVGVAFVAIGVYDATFEGRPFDLPQFGRRVGYFSVTAVLLAYLASHQHGLHADIAKLASFPDSKAEDEPTFLADTIRHVRTVMDVPRVVVVHADPEEPWLQLADCSAAGCQFSREPGDSSEALIAPALHGASFCCADADAPVGHVLYRSQAGLQRWRGQPVGSALHARLQARRVLSCPLPSAVVSGRIFFVNGPRASADDLGFAALVTGMFSVRLDQHRLGQQRRDRAVRQERTRMSRDLHDGLLQSLTAWGLQLRDIAHRLQRVDPAVAHRLQEMRQQMAADQRELRRVMGRLQADSSAEPMDFSLIGRLHDLRDRFREEWGLTVQMDFTGLHALVPPALRADICRIVHEGLANAARHAQTSLVRVEVAATDSDVFLTVQDRGRGFPFRGRHDLASLRAARIGPTSIVARVADLGGGLVLDSSDAGSRLDVVLPVTAGRTRGAQNAC
jgi:signal transduction histidine kinase